VLAGHIRHVDADVAPTETEYVPALQLMHADADVAPTEAEYVPASQLVHTLRGKQHKKIQAAARNIVH
jgi:hypothetical protein